MFIVWCLVKHGTCMMLYSMFCDVVPSEAPEA